MAKINAKFFYVGHGAMNYIQIFDDANAIVCQILIDAGCNDDKTDGSKRESNVAFVKEQLVDNKYVSTVILLTHFHDDHYNLLTSLITRELENVWLLVGSLTDMLFMNNPENDVAQLFHILEENRRMILPRIESPVRILSKMRIPVQLPDGIDFYCLWNNYFADITTETIEDIVPRPSLGQSYVNRNGAAFALCLGDNALLFLGDMTGANFWALLLEDHLRTSIQTIFGNLKIWMTVPHHGSMHTLSLEPMLHPFISLNLATFHYNIERLQSALTEVFSRPCGMYVSTGYIDKFCHPNCIASIAYDSCGNGDYSQEDVHFLAHKELFSNLDVNLPEQVTFEAWEEGKNYGWGNLHIVGGNTFATYVEEGTYWEKEI